MIEILITVLAPLVFNYSIQFHVCGVTRNASYIYMDPNEILLGVMGNSSVIDYKVINKLCNTSAHADTIMKEHSLSTDENTSMNNTPQYSVTEQPTNAPIFYDNKCNLHHYLSMLAAIATFLIGLVLRPDLICEYFKQRLRQQLYAGNTFQESEPGFRIP